MPIIYPPPALSNVFLTFFKFFVFWVKNTEKTFKHNAYFYADVN